MLAHTMQACTRGSSVKCGGLRSKSSISSAPTEGGARQPRGTVPNRTTALPQAYTPNVYDRPITVPARMSHTGVVVLPISAFSISTQSQGAPFHVFAPLPRRTPNVVIRDALRVVQVAGMPDVHVDGKEIVGCQCPWWTTLSTPLRRRMEQRWAYH